MITAEEIKVAEIRALSWKQPYAHLMLKGKQETRRWSTKYRGLVLICASATPYTDKQFYDISGVTQYNRAQNLLPRVLNQFGPQIINGHAIAIGRLVDCQNMQHSGFSIEELQEKTFVLYHGNLYVHFYKDVQTIKPFPWKGSQGWRILTPEQKEQIILL